MTLTCGGCARKTGQILKKNSVPVFLITGALNVVLTKLLYGCKAVGTKHVLHKFEKPWMANWLMFLAMCLCIVAYQLERLFVSGLPKTPSKLYVVIIIPAICDAIASFLMGVGLLWVSGSIWQMLRGSIILFTAFLKVTYRRNKLWANEWCGVGVVVVAIVVIGTSTFFTPGEITDNPNGSSGSSDQATGVPAYKLAIGIALVVGAQFLQATQTIIEEKLMHDIDAAPLLVVGMEGVWGLVICSAISMPIAQLIPGAEGNGLHEDTIDSFVMISQSGLIIGLIVAYMSSILFFNIFGMFITEQTDAMTRNILEPIRTLLVWVLMILTCYVFSKQRMGERVNLWSLLELGGFAILCFGILLYNNVIKIPGIPHEVKKEYVALDPTGLDTEKQPLIGDQKNVQEKRPDI